MMTGGCCAAFALPPTSCSERRPARRAVALAAAARRGWPSRWSSTPSRPPKGAAALGLHTVGDLLEHWPQDRREGRTVADAAGRGDGDDRRRGALDPLAARCAGAACARSSRPTVADGTGAMKATFFNQPWLERKYRPGTRLLLQGNTRAATASGCVRTRPPRRRSAPATPRAHYPATRGDQPDPDPRARAAPPRRARARRRGAAAGRLLRARAPARPRRPRCARSHLPRADGDFEGGRRRLAFEELLLRQLALLLRRARRRARGRRAAARRAARR